jgi:hypothetical protein
MLPVGVAIVFVFRRRVLRAGPARRALAWLTLAAAAPALWACTDRSLEAPKLKPEPTYSKHFKQTINRNVDMLFLVDDSSSMRLSQDNLRRNFPTFMTTLQNTPQGLPNIHVAVVSSDMGAGDGSVGGCDPTGGKRGIFQYTAKTPPPGQPTCTVNLNPDATFISDIAGVRNYTGALEDTFSCMAALWESGCGFEQQFASILRALGADGQPAPQENQGFLRPDAYLAIVLITNEDDCSATPGVPLFDVISNPHIASQLGPPANFRCNEFGHLCNDGSGNWVHPRRNAPNDDASAMVAYSECRSNDQEGYLLSAVDTANRIKALKSDPSQVIVASIQGPPTPYTVSWAARTPPDTSCGAASCPWPAIAHSCTASDESFADPGVRTAAFVTEFGANGLVLPICASSFAPSLDRIAELINASLQPPCIQQRVALKAGTEAPDCTVVSHTSDGLGGFIDATVPSCASNGGQAPCWRLTPGAADSSCAGGQTVDVSMPAGQPTSVAQNATVNCALCDPMFPDPSRGCP